jgi:hypothetical protein
LTVEFWKNVSSSQGSFDVFQLIGRYPKKYITLRYLSSLRFFGGTSFATEMTCEDMMSFLK